MEKYEASIRKLNKAKQQLSNQISSISNAAKISYSEWDADTRTAYQSIINSCMSELRSISGSIDELKRYIIKEEE